MADCSVTAAADTVAQLKPVKQDKSCLCQACTLQRTAEMMIAQESAHTAGVYLNKMTAQILRRLVHRLQLPEYKRRQSSDRSIQKKRTKKAVDISNYQTHESL